MPLAEYGTSDFHGLRSHLHRLGIVAERGVINGEVAQHPDVIGMPLAEYGTVDFHSLCAILHRLGIVTDTIILHCKLMITISKVFKRTSIVIIILFLQSLIGFLTFFQPDYRFLIEVLFISGNTIDTPFLYFCFRLSLH